MSVQRVLSWTLSAAHITSVDHHFYVFGLDMVEDMVLLSASVLTDQANEL